MNINFAACSFLLLALSTVKADEVGEINSNDHYEETENAEQPATMDVKASSLVQSDQEYQGHKGFCQWGQLAWYKPGFSLRCNCFRCLCQVGAKWDCSFFFSYCPFYYCNGKAFDPKTQICCCGKIHRKMPGYLCCGYFYFYTRESKCCNYYSVRPRNSNCPRYQVEETVKG